MYKKIVFEKFPLAKTANCLPIIGAQILDSSKKGPELRSRHMSFI